MVQFAIEQPAYGQVRAAATRLLLRNRRIKDLITSVAKDTIRPMLWTIAVILLILWLLGFSFHIGGALIHIILVIVVIVVVVKLVTGRGL